MNWLKRIRSYEPLRLIGYPVAALFGGYAVVSGVDVDLVDLIVGLVAVVLGVETARSKVRPTRGDLDGR